MKKILKFIAYAVGAVVLLAILLVLTLPLWLGTIFRPTVCAAVPKMTKTTFEMSKLYLNPYTGRFELGGFVLGNPKGYSEPEAVSISNLVLDVAMTTLADKYVHVEEITVDGVFVSYIDGGEHGVDNFTQIQYNVAGGKDKYEAKKKKKSEAENAEKEKEEKAKEDAVEEEIEELEKKKYVIDHLHSCRHRADRHRQGVRRRDALRHIRLDMAGHPQVGWRNRRRRQGDRESV